MIIEKIEIRKIFLPYLKPFETSGWVEKGNSGIIVKIYSDGVIGWGEAPVGLEPFYNEETTETAWHIQKDFLIPILFKNNISSPEHLNNLFSPIRANKIARAGIEFAFWDLWGKMMNKSISSLLGGTRKIIEVGVSIGIQKNINELIKNIEGYLDKGYKRIKIKIKPGYDVVPVKAIRLAYPDILLQVDANSIYTLNDALQLKELDDFNLLLIEQPLGHDDIYEHSLLQKKFKTPLCLDESIVSLKHAEAAVELGACRVINIKACRVGGLSEAKKIHDFCLSKDIPVWCGGMLETGIGRAINVQLASLPGFTLPGDISANDRYFKKDIVLNPFSLNADGTIDVPQKPGSGAEADEEYLDSVTQDKLLLENKKIFTA
ncbi:MAG TPA: o-succinylbenzoate synthase [Ignavibacteriaceae bacterium]|nr:o-succinylbenzoate synthase [Ignavibacteriaceae bacterium]